MAEIIDFNKNKENVTNEEKKEIKLADILNSIGLFSNTDEDNLEDFAELLALPDEHFKILSPLILEEFQRSLSSPNERLLLIQSLNISGIKAEELLNTLSSINSQIDEINDKILNQMKKDFLKQLLLLIVNAIEENENLPKRVIQIPIELCHPDAKMPTYANPGDAGMDIYALDDYEILPGETKLIPTGIKVAVPNGYELQIRPKSGRCLKTKLRIANSPATIDAGYRQEVGVIVENVEPPIKDIEYEFDKNREIHIESILHGSPYYIGKGEKFAQLVLSEVPRVQFTKVEDIMTIAGDRGGGFGSSGLN